MFYTLIKHGFLTNQSARRGNLTLLYYFHFVICLYHCPYLGDEASNGLTVSASVLNQPLCDGIVIKLLAAQTTEQVHMP